MKFLSSVALSALALALPALANADAADNYPSGPINVICTYSAGAPTDVNARCAALAAQKPEYFGQPMVVVNKAGAGGMTGWNWVIDRASRDGLTMTVYNLPNFISQSLVKETKYNIDNMEPLVNFVADPVVMMVKKDSPFQSVADVVEFAKKNPGKTVLNGAGLYIGHHIALLQLEKEAGIKLTYIPENGGSDAAQSIIAGKVMGGFGNMSVGLRFADNIKILGICNVGRHEMCPDVPTFIELGYKSMDNSTTNYRGLAFPAGVDKAIIEKAAKAAYAMCNDPLVIEKFKETKTPYKILKREEVLAIFKQREALLKELLGGSLGLKLHR
ncbi:MAG: tripartite tricarboxylate transporter substrate binding protein [Mailhella sp.]|nr:tripartite tricarboxylate transporter substrate binding protein [Mailhella sp.]